MLTASAQFDQEIWVDNFLSDVPLNEGESHPLPREIVDLVDRLEWGDNTWTIDEVYRAFSKASTAIMQPEVDAIMDRGIKARMKACKCQSPRCKWAYQNSKTGNRKMSRIEGGRTAKTAFSTIPMAGRTQIIDDVLRTGLTASAREAVDLATLMSRSALAPSYAKFINTDKWRIVGSAVQDPFAALTASFGAFSIGDKFAHSQTAANEDAIGVMEVDTDSSEITLEQELDVGG